jgi:hypothetical protein
MPVGTALGLVEKGRGCAGCIGGRAIGRLAEVALGPNHAASHHARGSGARDVSVGLEPGGDRRRGAWLGRNADVTIDDRQRTAGQLSVRRDHTDQPLLDHAPVHHHDSDDDGCDDWRQRTV